MSGVPPGSSMSTAQHGRPSSRPMKSPGPSGPSPSAIVTEPAPTRIVNGSPSSGSGVDATALRAEGHTTMPFHGDLRTAPVPGCVDGWLALHARFGRAPLADVLAPAIGYARDGFPASPALAAMAALLAGVAGAGALAEPMRRGQRVARPGVGAALGAIVADGRVGFYRGSF